jgi:hypothetical protein
MIALSHLVDRYQKDLESIHGHEMLPSHHQALRAMRAGVPASGVIPPAAPLRFSRGGVLTSSSGSYGRPCKGRAGSFPWFEYHLNQTNHAQSPYCRS